MEDVDPSSRRHSTQSSSSQSGRSRTDESHPDVLSKRVASPHSDENSFTSFPSLDPSLEESPVQLTQPRAASPHSIGRASLPQVASRSEFGDLFKPAAIQDDRDSLFDDVPKDLRSVPGALHLQTDVQVKRLISRVGSVNLVRQLAEDLAQRDAQVTQIQRKAEERERVLRKMLRECQISNLDVETKLRELEREHAKDASRRQAPRGGFETTIDDRLSEALSEEIEISEDIGAGSIDTFDEWQGYATVRRARTFSGSAELNSSRDSSVAGSRKTSEAGLSWKQYFGYGKSAAKKANEESSGTVGVRKATARMADHNRSLANDRRVSPASGGQRDVHQDDPSTLKARRPSASNASVHSNSSTGSWALRLVGGGGGKSTQDDEFTKPKVRASTVSNGASNVKTKPAPPQRSTSGTNGVRRPSSIATGPQNGTSKRVTPANASTTPLSPRRPSDSSSNFGPVEMDTILPEGVRPPSLANQDNMPDSTGLLTDRFGFIYDQRRRKRQRQADASTTTDLGSAKGHASGVGHDPDYFDQDEPSTQYRGVQAPSVAGTQTAAGWTDYLKVSGLSTELLSHTPLATPIAEITGVGASASVVDKTSQLVLTPHGTAPALSANPAPSPTHVIIQNAEIARPLHLGTEAQSEQQQDPVKALLSQLTEVHDSLQKDRTVKWNEFLRKVRAERKRKGDAQQSHENRKRGASVPEASLMDGEVIGVAGLGNKGKVGQAKWNEFKNLVLGGIPVAYRAKIWAECSGAAELRVPGYYDDLVHKGEGDPIIAQQIQMDITRTLTDNIFFRKGQGVQKLREVLLAYARRNPEIGYCQGMNLITANLLLIMPTAEDAFWVLTSMVEDILPEKYYDSSLLTSRADQVVLRSFVSEILPQLSAHLEGMSIELEALTFQWFLSVFTDCLSAEALFRVWDVVLCMHNGSTFLFQVALALLKLNEKSLLKCDGPAEVYGYINQQMTDHAISIDGLIKASEALKKVVRREEVANRREDAVRRELETLRQREAIRKGKGRVVDHGPIEAGGQSEPVMPEISKRPGGQLSRNTSAEDQDEIIQQYGEFEVRTPMPQDEEALWRA